MHRQASPLDTVDDSRHGRARMSADNVEQMLRNLEQRVSGLTGSGQASHAGKPSGNDGPADLARFHEKNIAAVEMIATELKRLRDELNRNVAPRLQSGLSALKSEFREAWETRQGAGNDELAAQIERLGQNVEALSRRADNDGLVSLREEIEQIRHATALLAREETLQDLAEQYGLARRSGSEGSTRELGLLATRLEQINDAIRGLPTSHSMDSLEEQLRRLALSVEQFARAQVSAAPGSLQAIERRLDEISRAIAAISAPNRSPDIGSLERIEARITALARQFEKLGDQDPEADLRTRLGQLADRVERAVSAVEIPARAIEDLALQIESLSARIDERRSGPISERRLKELETRLDAIVASLGEGGSAGPDMILDALDGRFSEMSRQLDGLATAGIDPELLRSLESQLVELNRQMSAPAPFDRQQILEAAREAAAATLRSLPAREGDPSMLTSMAQDLRHIEELSRRSNERNAVTFEAVHDTLLKIVDRLALLDSQQETSAVQPDVIRAEADPAREPEATRNLLDRIRSARHPRAARPEPDSVAGRPTRQHASLSGWQPESLLADRHPRRSPGIASRIRMPLLIGASLAVIALALYPSGKNLVARSPQPAMATLPAPAASIAATAVEPEMERHASAAETNIPLAGTSPAAELTPQEDSGGPQVAAQPAPAFPASPASPAVAAASIAPEDVPADMGPPVLREAAIAGDARAFFEIGSRYAEGRGVTPNLQEAMRWFELAADSGYAPARYRLANIHEKGLAGGERNLDRAKELYLLAAEQGSASAMHNLAVLFAMGSDGQPDNEAAARWFLQAAQFGVTDSQYNLGILTAKGVGVARDLAESYKWFSLAAASGDKDAEGKLVEIGEMMTPEDLSRARELIEAWEPKPAIPEANLIDIPESWKVETGNAPGIDMARAVTSIQRLLNRNGYDVGPADGVMGDRTRKAITAYQEDMGLPANGEVDDALVEALLTEK